MTDVYSIIFVALPLNWQSYRRWILMIPQYTGFPVAPNSLQFDPAPRAGEPMVSRRVPDYFLVRVVFNLSVIYYTRASVAGRMVIFRILY